MILIPLPTHPPTTTFTLGTVMATSTMNGLFGVSHLGGCPHSRDMMSVPAPSTKPVCPDHQRGKCSRLNCPYFHPRNLVSHLWAAPWCLLMFAVKVVDKPTRPTQQKITPAVTKQPGESTKIPAKPPTEPSPKVSTPKSPKPPKNDRKSVCSSVSIRASCRLLSSTLPLKVPPTVVPERQEQKIPLTNSCSVKSRTPQNPVPSTRAPRQPRPSPLASGSQTKAQASDSDTSSVSRTKNSNNAPTLVSTPPQTVASCSVAISAIIKDNKGPAPTQETPSSSSTSGTSSPKNKRHKKKVRRAYYFACIDDLIKYRTSRPRKQRIQQLRQPLHRKVCRQSKTLFKNPLLCSTIR